MPADLLGATMWVAGILCLGAPPALAVVSDRKARSFQVEAFGNLARMARRIRFMVWAVLLYHVGVIIHGVVTGDVFDLFAYPVSRAGLALYGRIMVAMVVYSLMWGVIDSIHRITRPRERAKERSNQG